MIIPAGFAQCNLKFTGTACPLGAQVVLGVLSGESEDNPTDVAVSMRNAWNATIRTVQTSEVTLSSILVKLGPNDVGPSTEMAVGTAGGATAGAVAPNTSVLMRKITAFGGHAGRGRSYWPGIGETNVGSNGALTPAIQASWQTQATAFLANLVTSDIPLVLLHGEGSPLSTPNLVTSVLIDGYCATQRRRLRR